MWRRRVATMRALMEELAHPQRAFASVHVGGTSGKGSVSVFIASVLQAAGYRIGLHTTPYLQSPREKYVVDGHPISQHDFAGVVDELRPALAAVARRFPGWEPAYVQVSTALAFQYFARQRVDIAVIEVSVGGRFDFTNVLEPKVSVITNVGLDHVSTLGPEIEGIAWHKAGIIKPATPVVSGVTHPAAAAVIADEVVHARAPLRRLGIDFLCEAPETGLTGARFDWNRPGGTAYRDLAISMPGEHQVANAALAIAALDVLESRGYPISEPAIRAGLRDATIPGRFEVVQGGPTVVLDGAHNREKASTLRAALAQFFSGRSLTLVLGVGAAKDARAIAETLVPSADRVICTEAPVRGKPAVPADELARLVATLGGCAEVCPDPSAAVERALACAPSAGVVCVAGSLYLVGHVRDRWFPNPDLCDPAVVPAGATA